MSNTREEYLVDCLKNVSLQRLRNLKMDMDRLARDSRIGNEKAFWSLLEFHNIRLDKQTKRVFYRQVADSRGINVTSVIKNLRRAQRKTGRDSVEVLPKCDSPVFPQENEKVSEATPTKLEIPKLPSGTRNYKLDKFRAKAMGVGKLRAALKKTTPLKAMKNEVNTDQPITEHPKETTVAAEESDSMNSKPTDAGNTSSKPIVSFLKTTDPTVKGQTNSSSTQGSATNVTKYAVKEENTDQSIKSSINNRKSGNFLELLLEEQEKKESKENKSDEKTVENNVQKSSSHVVGTETKSGGIAVQPPTTEVESSTSSSPEEVLTKSEPDLVENKDTNVVIVTTKTSEEDSNNFKEVSSPKDFETEVQRSKTPPSDATSSEKKETVSVTDNSIVDRVSNDDLKEEQNKERESEQFDQISLTSKSTPKHSKPTDDENIVANSQNNNDNEDINNAVGVETESSSSEKNTSNDFEKKVSVIQKDFNDFDSVQSQTAEQTETSSEDCVVEINKSLNKNNESTKDHEQTIPDFSIKDKSLETNDETLNNLNEPIHDDSIPDSKNDDETSLNNCVSNISTVESKNMTIDQTVLSSKSNEAEKSKTVDDDKTVENKVAPEAVESLGAILNEKENNKNSTYAKSNAESKRKRKKKSKVPSDKSSELKQSDETEENALQAKAVHENKNISDTKVLKDVPEENATTVIDVNVEVKREGQICKKLNEVHLDRCSISSQSSEEDNFSLNDALRSFSSGADVTEKINFGEVSIELSGAEGLDKKGKQFDTKDFPSLNVDWVYGCNTVQSQCMTTSKHGELIYYVGSIVIAYNVIRKSQRHYMEHSSNVTSITAHPSDVLVASAQEESSKKMNNSLQSQTDRYSSCDGSAHIRVWNTVTMETVRTIGLGILRSSVYKMQFLNNSTYFITIEHNEESTMTVWDGGCRVTSKSTSFFEPKKSTETPLVNKLSTSKKRFTPTLPTSYKRSENNKMKTQKQREENMRLAHSKTVNGPKGIAGSLCGELEFVTVGKHHLSFWKLIESCEDDGLEGVAISEPDHGDFGKNFFRAEYISTCVATSKLLDSGSIVTGDSNGTLLIWSEKSQAATKGYPHAHECQISSICISEDGYIFTAGAKDKVVNAFNLRKNKIDKCGSIKIPFDQGSATCLVCIEKSLLIATEKNLIVSVEVETFPTTQVSSVTSSIPKLTSKLSSRSYSFGSEFYINPTPITAKSLHNEPVTDLSSDKRVFTKFDTYELARGFSKGLKHICPLGPLKAKFSNKTDAAHNQTSDHLAVPSVEEGMAMIRKQMAKSAGARKFQETAERPEKAVYAWRSNNVRSEECSLRRPILSASSPRLLTEERVLLREKARFEDLQKSLPLFALTNHVATKQLFFEDDLANSFVHDCFVSSSADGWLTIYSSQEHIIIGRFKLSPVGKITCIDTCPQRHLVVVGTDKGHVTIIQINLKSFQVLSSLKCRCSGGGSAAIIALRFSPNGKKLALSVGYDVIILLSKPPLLSEHGRCVGHRSDSISCLDWSNKKYSGSYFLRSCATHPIPEVKTWHTDTLLEVRDIITTMEWATKSCILDYSTKGIWDKYSTPSAVSRLAVSTFQFSEWTRNSTYYEHTSNTLNSKLKVPSSDKRGTNDLETFLCIGDVDGHVTAQPYPCLRWKSTATEDKIEYKNEHRPHNTPIRNISVSSPGKLLHTSSEDGCAIVQWSIAIT